MLIVLFLIVFSSLLCFPETYSTYSVKSHEIVKQLSLKNATYLISQKEFDDFSHDLKSVKSFMNQFKNNRFTDSQAETIFKAARKHKISVIVLLTKIECESSMITNYRRLSQSNPKYQYLMRWILGYGMYTTKIINGKKYKPNAGFERQVYGAAKCLRYWRDQWKPGTKKKINIGTRVIIPQNAATYALYMYTPFWGYFKENGVSCGGNQVFVKVYSDFKKRFLKEY